MAFYETSTYKKENGKVQRQGVPIQEKATASYGRWLRSCELEKKSSLGEITKLKVENTKGGLNKKVTKATTYFPNGEKVVRNLITTSNKISKKYKK